MTCKRSVDSETQDDLHSCRPVTAPGQLAANLISTPDGRGRNVVVVRLDLHIIVYAVERI